MLINQFQSKILCSSFQDDLRSDISRKGLSMKFNSDLGSLSVLANVVSGRLQKAHRWTTALVDGVSTFTEIPVVAGTSIGALWGVWRTTDGKPVIGVSPVWPSIIESRPRVKTAIPLDGVKMGMPMACVTIDLVTVGKDVGRRVVDGTMIPCRPCFALAADCCWILLANCACSCMLASCNCCWMLVPCESCCTMVPCGCCWILVPCGSTLHSDDFGCITDFSASSTFMPGTTTSVVDVERRGGGGRSLVFMPQCNRCASRMNSSSSFSFWYCFISSSNLNCSLSRSWVSCFDATV